MRCWSPWAASASSCRRRFGSFDFLINLAGYSLTGMTDYMFNSTHSLFLRLLSLFHGWLPFLLVYLVWRIGYDRRALPAWTGLFIVDMLICFFVMPPPTPHPGLPRSTSIMSGDCATPPRRLCCRPTSGLAVCCSGFRCLCLRRRIFFWRASCRGRRDAGARAEIDAADAVALRPEFRTAFYLARSARRLARLRRLYRLHCARRHGDRRRRVGGGEFE